MSRLQRHRSKQFTLTVIFYGAILLIIIILISTIGLRLLLNTSLFVADLARPKTDNKTKNNNDELVGKIIIDDIPTATNEAKITISGLAANYKELDFYINDELVKEIKPDKDQFVEEIGDLQEGENTIYLKGKYAQDKENETQKYIIIYKKEKPKLEIKEPQDKSTVINNELKIAGTTDKEVNVKINQLPVVVDTEGNFQTIIRLVDGENKIMVEAEDAAGNIEKQELAVIYSRD